MIQIGDIVTVIRKNHMLFGIQAKVLKIPEDWGIKDSMFLDFSINDKKVLGKCECLHYGLFTDLENIEDVYYFLEPEYLEVDLISTRKHKIKKISTKW